MQVIMQSAFPTKLISNVPHDTIRLLVQAGGLKCWNYAQKEALYFDAIKVRKHKPLQ